MRVLCREAELIPAKFAGRKSKDQRKPCGDASPEHSFPPVKIIATNAAPVTARTKPHQMANERTESSD